MLAMAIIMSFKGVSLINMIHRDLYDSFKTALKVLISANYFHPQHVKKIEDHFAIIDARIIVHKHALKRWDEGRKHEDYKNVVAELAKLKQSFNKDELELAELEGRVQLIRKGI